MNFKPGQLIRTVSEGRVYKSNINPALSSKVINNRYLLKHEA